MRNLILTLIFLTTFFIQSAEFAVNPMMINIEAKPNQLAEFDFNVLAKANGNIKITPYAMSQLETGHMGFTLAGEQPNSSANWLKFSKSKYSIRRDQTQVVKGAIKIPNKAVGTHLAAVMVEEDLPANASNGVVVKVRYAVILNVKVNGRKRLPRAKTSFVNVALNQNENKILLEGWFSNQSTFVDRVFSEVQIRNSNRRLVARFPLKTESAWQRQDIGSEVYPHSKVRLTGLIEGEIPPGEYLLMIRNKFGKRSQPTYKQTIIVPESEETPTEIAQRSEI